MRDFNVNLLSRNKMLLGKQYDSYSQVSPPIKKLCGSLVFALHQLIMETTRTTKHTKIPVDRVLTNYPEKVIQSGVIETGLSNYE